VRLNCRGKRLKTQFVLVDFENVQPKDLALSGGSYKIKIFLGTNQAKIPVATARALQAFGPDVEYVQINGGGKNALDFHIAYYIGRLAAAAPGAHFHVISKDTGFDPLLKHLKEQGIVCRRSASIAAMAPGAGTVSGTESTPDRVKTVVENLAKRKTAKPRTLKTLRSTVKALFGSQLTEDELDRLIEQLSKRGVIKIADGKVQYALPT
jgi:PIN domain